MAVIKKKINDTQTGAALVEFAIILPLLLLLVVGIVEFSFAFYHLNILNKSVEDGARYFSDLAHATNDGFAETIDVSNVNPYVGKTKNLVIYGNTAGTGNPLMPNPANNYSFANNACPNSWLCVVGADGNHIRVTAVYSHNFLLGNGNVLTNFIGLAIPNPYPLTASTVMRVQ